MRARAWAGQVGLLFGAWWLTAPVLAAGLFSARKDLAGASLRDGRNLSGLVIAAYILGYLVIHVAFTFQPWDRYLLPILPLICALGAHGALVAYRALRSVGMPRGWRSFVGAAAACCALYAASLGVTGAIPAGSDVGAYRGVAEAARFLAEQPGRSTVYYEHLGWHLDYYLYDRPVTRSWYDSPAKLASETARVAREHPGERQWLALPAWEAGRLSALGSALAARGFVAEPDAEVISADGKTVDLTLYRLVPRRAEVAAAGKGATP
jgi:hypothetical protein